MLVLLFVKQELSEWIKYSWPCKSYASFESVIWLFILLLYLFCTCNLVAFCFFVNWFDKYWLYDPCLHACLFESNMAILSYRCYINLITMAITVYIIIYYIDMSVLPKNRQLVFSIQNYIRDMPLNKIAKRLLFISSIYIYIYMYFF